MKYLEIIYISSMMIKSKEKLLNVFNTYKIYLIFLIIFSPIFISLDFSNGMKFDAWVGNLYSKPSIPVSFLLLGFISIFSLKTLFANRKLILLFVLISVYIVMNIYYGTPRAVVIGLGMLLPLVSFFTFKNFLNNTENTYRIMFLTLFSVIVIKFVFDFYRIYIDNMNEEVLINGISNIRFNTTYYFLDSIRIYNYYDYFSFIYYVATILSFHNIIHNNMVRMSLLLILISSIAILSTGSRLFIYGIYLIPVLYIFYKITRLKLETYFYIFMLVSLSITLTIGFVDFNLNDISFSTRNNLAYSYFDDFSFINLITPFNNQQRIETLGSFHNELLEIFSFFGFIIIYYYYLVMKIYSGINEKYKLISFFLIFIIIIGSLIQINISNPYVGIMLGMILAVLSLDNKDEKLENATS